MVARLVMIPCCPFGSDPIPCCPVRSELIPYRAFRSELGSWMRGCRLTERAYFTSIPPFSAKVLWPFQLFPIRFRAGCIPSSRQSLPLHRSLSGKLRHEHQAFETRALLSAISMMLRAYTSPWTSVRLSN